MRKDCALLVFLLAFVLFIFLTSPVTGQELEATPQIPTAKPAIPAEMPQEMEDPENPNELPPAMVTTSMESGALIAEHHEQGEGSEGHEGHGDGEDLGKTLPLWSVIPFVGILLSIALFPLFAPRFWHHHYPKVSAFWAFCFAVPFLMAYSSSPVVAVFALLLPVAPAVLTFRLMGNDNQGLKWGCLFALLVSTAIGLIILHGHGGAAWYNILHIYIIDYIPFIILLWSLYTVAGGMVVSGKLRGSPLVNTLLLLIGTALASWIGTTGAAMLMIRPVLRANSWRRHNVHVIVFFIFMVANVGGSLTPLGDPPLFLGFLHGVDFFWTMKLLPHMLFVIACLTVMFFALDSWYFRKEGAEPPDDGVKEPIRVKGLYNLIFLAGIVGSVLASGMLEMDKITVLGVHVALQNLLRDGMLILMGIISLAVTSKALREANDFSWGPIQEVAYLFAGIFMTIIPALAILRAGSDGALAFLVNAVNTPGQYFWATGMLSSFLDNAPTYLTFFSSAQGKLYPGVPEAQAVQYLMGDVTGNLQSGAAYLVAISAGAVFMGANTYIGNAPNFMVKSIAEEAGVPMPSFFGYIFKYSLPMLVVLFILVSLIFF